MIIIKTKEEIEIMRAGGKILAAILHKLVNEIKPGITTGYLEKMACGLIKEAGGRPALKGYQPIFASYPFPTALCASINDEVVHVPALPARELKAGDIISIDFSMEYPSFAEAMDGKPYKKHKSGYYTDMAVTVPVGSVSKEARKLIKVTRTSLDLAIRAVKPGATLNDIGTAVQRHVEAAGFSVVRDLVGHGVGRKIHEDPQVPNYKITDNSMDNVVLRPGMAIAIEPMVNAGDYKIKCSPGDDYTVRTKDGSLSAHFEHTVAVTENGCEVLTAL